MKKTKEQEWDKERRCLGATGANEGLQCGKKSKCPPFGGHLLFVIGCKINSLLQGGRSSLWSRLPSSA